MSQSALEKLFAVLERAGVEYTNLHRAITAIFSSKDCGADSEGLADVTLLDRLAGKIDQGEQVRNFAHFSRGIARLVYLEYLKDRQKLRNAIREMNYLNKNIQEPEEEPDLRRRCQEFCVGTLSGSERQLVVAYYLSAKHRAVLAEELGLLINTLGSRIHRLKLRLKKCEDDCRKRA